MMSLRLLVAAQLMYFYLLTILVTVFVSFVALWHYAGRVLAGMAQGGAGILPFPPHAERGREATRGTSVAPLAWDGLFGRRLVVAWLLATFLAALPLACAYLVAHGRLDNVTSVLAVASAMAMVAVPVLGLARGWHWLRGVAFAVALALGAAAAIVVASALEQLLHGESPGRDSLLNFVRWFKFAAAALGPLFGVLLICTPRRIRQVVPLLFGALLLFGLAPFAGTRTFDAMMAHEGFVRLVLLSDRVEGAMAVERYVPFVLLAIPAGMLVAWRLRALAAAYAAKRFSSLELQARAWWLMMVVLVAIQMANNADVPWWGPWGVAGAALGFAPVQRGVFRRLDIARGAPPARTLLFLRAFGYRARTERLFDRIAARWVAFGPITMIAAPDVVAHTIDSADLLAWLQGREGDMFVRSQAELDARLACIDSARDPDGRFRLNEFCCADTTWQAAVVALIDRADAVLMDLRGVQSEKPGCAFELAQVATRMEGRRVVLVVNRDTRLAPLQAALGDAAPRVTWHVMDDERTASYERLFAVLVTAAA
jgi:hypothetical protein